MSLYGSYKGTYSNRLLLQPKERPLLKIQRFSTGSAVAEALEQGQLDMAFHLPVDELPALRQVTGVTVARRCQQP